MEQPPGIGGRLQLRRPCSAIGREVVIRPPSKRPHGVALRRWIRRLVAGAGLLCCALAPGRGAAQEDATAPPLEPPRQAIATLVPIGPQVDGDLSDPVWAQAVPAGPFTQVQPVQGERPSRATEVRFLVDEDALYIAVRCHDPTPDEIIARNMQRDGDTTGEDRFTIVLDTFRDRRNAHLFQTNPLGLRRDALVEEGRFALEWDGIWNVKTVIDDKGWTAEFVIPFKTLNFREGAEAWGVNFSRQIRGTQEDVRWTDADQNRNLLNLGRAGDLVGLAHARQGLGLDIIPSLTVRRVDDQRTLEGEDSERHYTRITPSLDFRYKITPSLTAAGTANTDFGTTPIDDVQVNLGRSAIFFPEKREFFLQDLGIFDFGNIRQDAQPFFSRRIGFTSDGDEVPIRGGLKVSGRQGPVNMGALVVNQKRQFREDPDDRVPTRTLAVARVKVNVGEQSNVGMIGTFGDPQDDRDNFLVGADATYRTTTMFGDKVFQATAWYQRSHTYNDDGEACETDDDQPRSCNQQNAYGFEVLYPNDRINWNFLYQDIQEDFDPALGFVRRDNTRRARGNFRYRWRPGNWIQTIDTNLFGFILTESDDAKEIQDIGFRSDLIRIQTLVGDELRVFMQYDYINEQEPRRLFDDVAVPERKSSYWTGGFLIRGTRSRKLSGSLNVRGGSFYDGYRLIVQPEIEWRPIRQLRLGASYSRRRHWNLQRLPDDPVCNEDSDTIATPCGNSFTVNIVTARLEVQLSPDLSWNNLVQFENDTDEVLWQSRVRWTVTPGSDIFLILNQGFLAESGKLKETRTEPLVRVAWTFRF